MISQMYKKTDSFAMLPANEQAKVVQQINELKLDEMFNNIDWGSITREAATKVIDLIRDNVLPIFREKFGPVVSLALTAVLDTIQAQLK